MQEVFFTLHISHVAVFPVFMFGGSQRYEHSVNILFAYEF